MHIETDWWLIEAADPATGDDLQQLSVPAASGEAACERLWALGLVTGAARRTRLWPDTSGEVATVLAIDAPEPGRLLRASTLAASMLDRHFLLHKLTENPDDVWVTHWGWQWFAEWPVIRHEFTREWGRPPPALVCPWRLMGALERRGFPHRAAEVEAMGDRAERGSVA